MEANQTQEVSCTAEITKVHFQGKNNFCIVKAKVIDGKSKGKTFSFKGAIHPCVVGYSYKFTGTPYYDKKYDQWQMNVTSAEVTDSMTRNGIYNYLIREGSNIGDRRAFEIVTAFGEKALEVIENQPELLVQRISGMTASRAEELSNWMKGEKRVSRLKKFLYEQGLSQSAVGKVIGHFGYRAPEVLRENVFRLTEVSGIGFLTAAKIADKMGVPAAHPGRVRAGVLYTVNEIMEKGGHTCCYRDRIVRESCKLLGLHQAAIDAELVKMLDERLLVGEHTDPKQISLHHDLFEETHVNAHGRAA